MTRCEMELCPYWAGDGDACVCAVLGIARPDRPDRLDAPTGAEASRVFGELLPPRREDRP